MRDLRKLLTTDNWICILLVCFLCFRLFRFLEGCRKKVPGIPEKIYCVLMWAKLDTINIWKKSETMKAERTLWLTLLNDTNILESLKSHLYRVAEGLLSVYIIMNNQQKMSLFFNGSIWYFFLNYLITEVLTRNMFPLTGEDEVYLNYLLKK